MADDGINPISGFKGGGGSQRTPVEHPNSLYSTAIARIVDLLSEGEIVGLENGLKDVFLDETPVMNADGSMNFQSVAIDVRNGTPDQTFIPGFPSVQSEVGVGVELKQVTPWVHAVVNTQLSAVKLRLAVQALSKTDPSNGDTFGYRVDYAIDLSTDGGSYVEVFRSAFSGKTTSIYERTHRIDLPAATTGWNVRVRRITPDDTSSYIQDTTIIQAITEIVDAKLRYPYCALVGISLDASQFRSIPRRSYRAKGRIIRVPVNYDPVKRVYDGVWNGTFKLAWTNNPAWIWYDLATNTRYGLGRRIPEERIDIYSLYKIAQYCDELVPIGTPKRATLTTGAISLSINGTARTVTRSSGDFIAEGFLVGDSVELAGFSTGNNGKALVTALTATVMTLARVDGYTTQASAAGRSVALTAPIEPRFTCTVYLQKQASAHKVMQDLASVFRGISYWAGGSVVAHADMPEDPVFTYTNANVKDGKFSYNGTGKKARHTVAMVAWSNPDNFGRGEIEPVLDEDGIVRYGIQPTNVTAFGATSQSQAQRVGRWMLLTELAETDALTFEVGLDGELVAPGKIIRVVDKDRAGRRIGGRVSSAAASSIVVDQLPTPTPTAGDTLVTITPSGTTQENVIQSVTVGTRTIVTTAPFSAVPVSHSIWAVESTTLIAQTYRVLGITDNNGGASYGISAMQHNASKFAAVDEGTKLETKPTSILPSTVQQAPASVTLVSVERAGQVIASTMVTAKWAKVAGAVAYYIQWKRGETDWSPAQKCTSNDADLENCFPGEYVARVWAINVAGISSPLTQSNKLTVADQALKPGFVEALETDIADALLTAQNAQATADGAIVSFWQTSPPVIGSGVGEAKVGDIWFDTDDGNKIYRVVSGSWVVAADDDMAQAILAATNAQATADGKVKTYFQSTAPSGTLAQGDLWFDTDDKKLYRWDGAAWSQNVADVTLAQLAGNGHNLLWDEHARFPASPLPTAIANAGAPAATWNAAHAVGTGGSLQTVTATTSTSEGYYLGDASTDYHMPLPPGKYIFSAYVMSSAAGHLVRLGLRRNNDGVTSGGAADVAIVNADTWERISIQFDFTSQTTLTAVLPFLYTNRSGVAGRTVKFDGMMLEHQVGTQTFPSAWTPGKSGRMAINAIAAAAAALDVADGKIETYFQTTMPAGTLGDLWFDTDDGNKIYRHNGTTYVEIQDDAIAQAIANAAGAQATADGRVTTFYTASAPTPNAVGDLWYNTTDKDLSRWNGSTWVKVGDITSDKIGGTGVNILWEEYSQLASAQASLSSSTQPAVEASAITLAAVADAAAFGGFSYRATTSSTSTVAYARFGVNGTDDNVNVGGNRKYLISYYAKANVAGHQVRPFTRGVADIDGTVHTLTTTRTRYTWVWDASALADAAQHFGLFCNTSGVSGRIVTFDGFMVEPMVGNETTPSQFVAGPSVRQTARAIANAALAQATADGKIDSFYQASPPGVASEGDIWFDTDDGNKIYTRRSGAWVATPDSGIAQAITDAAGAQATADGKVTTFYQTTTPTAIAIGDLWFNKNTSVLSRWSGSAWATNFAAPTSTANGANLLPNPSFTQNSLASGAGGTPAINTQLVDGWMVNRDNSAWGAEVYVNWPTTTAGILRCTVNTPAAVPTSTLVAGQARTLLPIPVEAGAKYIISFDGTPSYNGTLPGGVTAERRIAVQWFTAANAVTGSLGVASLGRVSTTSATAEITAPADAAHCHVYLDVVVTNSSGSAWTHNSTVALRMDFKTVSMIRKVDLDTFIDDGTNYGRYSVLDRFSFGGVYRLGLRVGTSGHRIGNQRNLVRSNTSAYGMIRSTTALSATSAGAVSVNAHTARYGGYSVAYNAVSNAVTGLTVGTSYVIYCSDPDLTGGTKTYFATTNPDAAMNISDDIYVVGQITIPSSGSSSGGGGGGGGDPGDWCVDWETAQLPDGRFVRDLRVGDEVPCWNMDPEDPRIEMHPVLAITTGWERSYDLLCGEEAVIRQSASTPMVLRDGRVATTEEMLGEGILVNRDGVMCWESVTELLDVRLRKVVKMNCGDRVFFAGFRPRVTVATHNAIYKP